MNVEQWPIGSVIPYARNPRKNENAVLKVAASIKEYGWRQPLVVDAEGVVIAGHTRLLAAKHLKLETVPVHVASDMNPIQAKAYRLADNRVAQEAEWDDELLALEIEELGELGLSDLDALGFEDDELANLRVSDVEETEGLTDPDEVPEPPEEPTTKLGDLWQLGRHRLLCGDSTKTEDVAHLLGESNWDVCVFDPPYEIEELYSSAMPASTPGKKIVVMWDFKRFAIAAKRTIDKGWTPQYEFIWDCVQSWYTPNRPLARHKSAGVFGDDPFFDTEQSIIKDGKKREAKVVSNTRGECNYTPLDGAKHIATVEAFPNTSQNDSHGHGKPVKWISAIFNGIGGQVYLDLFGGSGSTLIACEKTARDCFMMELDPKYCDVIVQRWEEFTGQKAVLANG